MKISILLPSAFLILGSGISAAQSTNPDWPCIQVLVPEIVPAVVWPEEIGEDIQGQWKQVSTIKELAEELGDLEQFTDEHSESIKKYAESIPEAERLDQLNKLTDGIVAVTNQQRTFYIDGIQRYTRQQIAIASQIESTLNELADLDQQNVASTDPERAEIEETLKWHERVYDQRERSIRALCERPVEREVVLSDVLRELAQYLP